MGEWQADLKCIKIGFNLGLEGVIEDGIEQMRASIYRYAMFTSHAEVGQIRFCQIPCLGPKTIHILVGYTNHRHTKSGMWRLPKFTYKCYTIT